MAQKISGKIGCYESIGKTLIIGLCFALQFIILTLLFNGCSGKDKAQIVLGTFTVNAGDHDRIDTPVRFPCRLRDILPDSLIDNIPTTVIEGTEQSRNKYQFMLVDIKNRKSETLVQWEPKPVFNWEHSDREGSLCWIQNKKLLKGASRSYHLVLKKSPPSTGAFTIQDIENNHLLVQNKKQPVLRYNYGMVREKEGQTGLYDRSSYFHPVWTPTGKIITGDFSPEHIHQRGIYLAWRPVKFGDVQSDFWGLGEATGRVMSGNKKPKVIQGSVFTELVIRNNGMVEDQLYFKEIGVIKIYSLAEEDIWMFDLLFRQIPVDPKSPDQKPGDDLTMELEKLYYGGMSFRGPAVWLRSDAKDVKRAIERGIEFKDYNWLPADVSLDISTSEGGDRKSGDGTLVKWIDYTGPIDNDWGGLTMFDSNLNLRYPTPVRIHPELPYFSWAFVRNEPYTIQGDKSLDLLYRVVIHDGRPDKERNERIHNDFVNPPKVTWQP